jgi:hypothetical protein
MTKTFVQRRVDEILEKVGLDGAEADGIRDLMEAVGIATALECGKVAQRFHTQDREMFEAIMLVAGKREWVHGISLRDEK